MISVSGDAAALGIRIAYATADVRVGERSDEMEAYSKELIRSVKVNEELIRAYRSFYWRMGIDPTKTRPSNEAMLRRVLKKGEFPRINNVVDAINMASFATLIPIGLYDLDKLSPPIEVRLAREGEEFHPIGGGLIRLKGGEPVVSDSKKIMFLYPYRDSDLTKVDEKTTRVLILGAGVSGVEIPAIRRAVNMAIELLERFCGGKRTSDTLIV
ncbi:MAG: B3/B4 domain-containing protein [Candidatus Methanodesulfokora sp.]